MNTTSAVDASFHNKQSLIALNMWWLLYWSISLIAVLELIENIIIFGHWIVVLCLMLIFTCPCMHALISCNTLAKLLGLLYWILKTTFLTSLIPPVVTTLSILRFFCLEQITINLATTLVIETIYTLTLIQSQVF